VNVVWTELAVERAYEEARYIAQDKPSAALRWLDGLFASTDRLAMFPRSGSVVAEIGDPAYRQIIYRSHRVIYRVEPKRVAILTVRHGKRQLDLSEVLP
jgi:plasmid stabilization system protein ParE